MQQRGWTPVHQWNVDHTPGCPTTYMTFHPPYASGNDHATMQKSERSQRVSSSADRGSDRGSSWRWWPFGREKEASTGEAAWDRQSARHYQSRAEWARQIEELSYLQPLHIHTILLPPGMTIDDPRLREAKIISQETYWTDRPLFPNGTFVGDIRQLPTDPSGPRIVG